MLSSHLDLYCRRLRWEEFFRLREEIRALGSGVSATRAFRRGILERLKLSGHGLEILARARSASVGDPLLIDDAREISEVMLARDMSMLAGRVDPDGTLLKKLKTTDPELWERWLGDGCHVLHGLRLWQLDRR